MTAADFSQWGAIRSSSASRLVVEPRSSPSESANLLGEALLEVRAALRG
ncbi:hypothetical protein [Saccharothrix coeruleofusca]|nr:hypothetical protein [Saccharothrix coeruleofusca]